MGVLALDAGGRLKTDWVGGRSWGAGALIGHGALLLGPGAVIAAPLLSGGMSIIGGTARGELHHKSLKMSDEDQARLSAELTGGKAAVAVKAGTAESAAIVEKLAGLGGVPETFHVSEEILTAANDAVAGAQAEA